MPPNIELRSSAFSDHAPIPARYSREGENVPPPLEWSGVPADAVELAIVVEDPDAPGGTFTHWIVAGLPPVDGAIEDGALPSGTVEGRNDFGEDGYGGPQPPPGDDPHRYFFKLFAAREPLGLSDGARPVEVGQALEGKTAATGTLVGTFGR